MKFSSSAERDPSRRPSQQAILLKHHLDSLYQSYESPELESLLRFCAIQSQLPHGHKEGIKSHRLPGGINEDDLARYGSLSHTQDQTVDISHELEIHLVQAIDRTLASFRDIIIGITDDASGVEGEVEGNDPSVLDSIVSLKASITQDRTKFDKQRECVIDLVSQVNDLYPRLEATLLQALSEIPPKAAEELDARTRLQATRIEVAIKKVQLLSARFHQTIYGYTGTGSGSGGSSSKQARGRTLGTALDEAMVHLKEEEQNLLNEEEELDRKLLEYNAVLNMVDSSTSSMSGDGGRRMWSQQEKGRGKQGFARIVEDWARVMKDKEECVKDLRRLGWTDFEAT